MSKKIHDLKKIWEEKNKSLANHGFLPLPGTVEDFIKFVGAKNLEQIEKMDFTALEQLPGVIKHGLISCGGNLRRGTNEFRWSWELEKYNKSYGGLGKTYNEAAMDGLILFWEIHDRLR